MFVYWCITTLAQHTRTHSHALTQHSHSLIYTHAHSHTTFSRIHTHSHALTQHTHTNSRTNITHSLTLSLTITLSLSPSLTLTHSLTHSLTHTVRVISYLLNFTVFYNWYWSETISVNKYHSTSLIYITVPNLGKGYCRLPYPYRNPPDSVQYSILQYCNRFTTS